MIYEIRDYHYQPKLLDAYRKWAEDAVPVLRDKLDLVGFWIDPGAHPPELNGSDPEEPGIGWANVTWIIRWESKSARDEAFPKVFASDEWKAVWSRHPDPNGYVQTLGRFMEAM